MTLQEYKQQVKWSLRCELESFVLFAKLDAAVNRAFEAIEDDVTENFNRDYPEGGFSRVKTNYILSRFEDERWVEWLFSPDLDKGMLDAAQRAERQGWRVKIVDPAGKQVYPEGGR